MMSSIITITIFQQQQKYKGMSAKTPAKARVEGPAEYLVEASAKALAKAPAEAMAWALA